MELKKLLVYSSLFIFHFSLSFGQSWDWGAQGIGGTKVNDFGSAVATDKSGNAYIAKSYLSQISFGPDTLFGVPTDNMYFVKYNSAGAIQWAITSMQGYNAQTIATYLTTDTSGNVFITGSFNDTLIFGSNVLYTGSTNSFIVKFDGNGNVIWSAQSANGGTAFANSVATDEKGNSYVTGYFIGQAYFGPYTLSNTGAEFEVFVVKYDINGNVVWAKQSNCSFSTSYAQGNSIVADKSGNTYITGYFRNNISFGTDSLSCYSISATNNSDIFLAKFDSSGNVKWAKQADYTSIYNTGEGCAVTIDASGNPYITGYFKDTIIFGTNTLIAQDSDMFLAKFDTSGTVSWAEQTTEGSWIGYSLASDANNNIYLGGVGTADTLMFGVTKLYNPGNHNSSFILKINSSGTVQCGSMLVNGGGTGRNYEGVASDSSGKYIYLAGSLYYDSVFCASDILIATNGGTAPYIARWMTCDKEEGILPITSLNPSITLFPNPNNGIFTISFSNPPAGASQTIVEVYNVLGEKVYFATLKQVQGDNLINLTGQMNGLYLYRVITETGALVGEGKLIIQK